MRKINILIIILFALLCMAGQGMAKPEVLIDNQVFTFDSVFEGVHVSHDFIIKNTGDKILHINSVNPP